ncbi:winged helix-turn-helix domain-containing protein [Candidatus Binatia bacterium]|nr:winged helix-turn-helix domain-containing protein [Candidatus Binatia bacterium]
MIKDICEAAGLVWHFLDEHGSTPVGTLKRKLKLGSEAFYGALGWLAREDKLAFEGAGKKLVVALK